MARMGEYARTAAELSSEVGKDIVLSTLSVPIQKHQFQEVKNVI